MNGIIKLLLVIVINVCISLIFCPEVKAVTITINSFPATIDTADPYQVNASVSGAVNATNYLRIDLYKDGTTNYFGETYNGSDWYGGSDGKSYFPVQILNASASATITFQIGNPSNTNYPGPGSYKLKIRRYTSSGSASSNDSITPADVQINYIFPTPTPTPSPTPTPTPTDPPTPVPTPTKTPTPTPTKTPTPTPIRTPTLMPSPTDSPISLVLGDEVVLGSPTPLDSPVLPSIKNTFPFWAVGLVVLGLGFVGIAIYFIIRNVKKEDTQIS